jgi:formylglycine-generating enzyme required for sulfatase activity
MSPFEEGLRQARRRQVRLYLGGLAALVLIGLVVLGVLASTSGTLIEVAPDEARAEAQVTLVSGFGMTVGKTVYSLTGAPTVEVASEGFRTRTHDIRPDETGRAIEIRLEPLPGRLTATTNRALPETRWTLNGERVAVAAGIDLERPAGRYALIVDHPFFEPVEQMIELQRGQTEDLQVDLKPVAGSLAITSEPSGAEVFVNGVRLGVTPLDTPVAGGDHALRVVAEDRQVVEEAVQITNTAPRLERRYILRPLTSTLTIEALPAGGELLVNGRRVPASGQIEVTANEDHTVTYVRPGYRAKSQTVRLEAKEQRTLTIRLQEELGIVDIRTTPGADILVDGQKVGSGSVELQLRAVPHTIELRKAGYRTIRRTLTPSEQRRLVIRDELIGETAARLAESPRAYTNSVGMALVLFEPGSFDMGAPRSQKGQRANEFEKRVNLTKAFYAARHEVTNGQFSRFRGGNRGAASAPVTGVSWLAAAEFSNWLSAQENLAPFYRITNGRLDGVNAASDGYRLLTEAEWEWLARKAGRSAQTVFSWGDTATVPRNAGNIADESANGLTRFYVPRYYDGFARIAPVGSFPAEPSGLFDLTGNVSEWTHDFYSLQPPVRGRVEIDPLGPGFGDTHVVKGSSWKSGTLTELRASWRDGSAQGSDDIGFRVGRYLHGA